MKSAIATPFSCRYLPAGESGLIEPAGEMWSVVVESPTITRHRASLIAAIGGGSTGMSTKNGGSWM